MTQVRLTKRRNRLEKRRDEVIKALATQPRTLAEIASDFGVSESALYLFQERHAEEIEPMRESAREAALDFAIAQKVHRMRNKQMLWSLLGEVVEARKRGETGLHTGLVVKTVRELKSGTLVEEYRIDDGLLAAVERLETSAAHEMGDIPRPDQNINVKALLLVREIDGASLEELG